ncbi:VOC family protein [Neptunicella sp.]|uniref:VOC family protein n=1 Tax=Neptunicella sp. TaxID=2125986 RepID=UPI003F691A92
MSLSIHINFNGQCQEAFEFYAEHLHGTIGTMLSYKNSPVSATQPADWQNKIVHANILIKDIELAGADVKPEQYQQPTGFNLLLGCSSENEVNTMFDLLSAGGQVILAPQTTFWSARYAIVIDRFGVPWKLNCGT